MERETENTEKRRELTISRLYVYTCSGAFNRLGRVCCSVAPKRLMWWRRGVFWWWGMPSSICRRFCRSRVMLTAYATCPVAGAVHVEYFFEVSKYIADVSNLPLPTTWLVSLSRCQTREGKHHRCYFSLSATKYLTNPTLHLHQRQHSFP